MANRIRTLLIDDSEFMRKVIGDIITSDSDIDLVGMAADGKEGREMFLELKPDVVVTDMVMPEYDGMYVVHSVMENRPVPVILLSSLEKTSPRIFDALKGGAFEFIDKPSDLDLASIKNYRLLDLIKEASKTDMSLLVDRQQSSLNVESHTFAEQLHYEVVAIGASTGGPSAIELIINNLPKNLQVPIVIAQHMPARFLETFAHRLNEHSELSIRIPRKGEVVRGGTIYIAPGEQNIKVERNLDGLPAIGFTNKKYDEFNYPSVNCLFESIAEVYANKSIGVILTGMGKDGMNGMRKIFQKGGFTIAQDEESSIVYGMPKAAVENGAVKQTVPLKEIAGFIISCL